MQELAKYHCDTRMHVVRLFAPRLDNETHTKHIDFSPEGIRRRWEAGYAETNRALERQAWLGEFGLLDGGYCMSLSQAPSLRRKFSLASQEAIQKRCRQSLPLSEEGAMGV